MLRLPRSATLSIPVSSGDRKTIGLFPVYRSRTARLLPSFVVRATFRIRKPEYWFSILSVEVSVSCVSVFSGMVDSLGVEKFLAIGGENNRFILRAAAGP
jgi:hypothetical protein